ncbi:tagaturonate reductase [Algoriphagus kandeliae]|uniref:Tagaturonate reductase n=1 Tax=Algoriphagus kandeliae TaxID=2562278 RepID=A0A4Y9QKI8_9BACT|nr:tagaturonate reductase [Algoriphagus kandeliae]TFV93224.1 tagaturonate reductase [Algoriphagus kandeliae]
MNSSEPIEILQIGNGNFLRGFVDWMIQVADEKGVFNGKIHSVQIHSKQADPRMQQQNNRFHVWEAGIENGRKVSRLKEINCIAAYSCVKEDFQSFLKIAENPHLKFVISNTTEAGIVTNPEDENFENIPTTFPGKLTQLLWRRYLHFDGNHEKGLIFLPCELIEKNGQELKKCIQWYAKIWKLEEDFSLWLDQACTFCDTLVDRIVPGFPKENYSEIQPQLHFPDELLVMAEPFHFWAIQGPDWLQKIFPLDIAGLNVKFVKDLTPYRTRKVRILNGAHTALVPFAFLQGFRTVRECLENPEIENWLKAVLFEEVIPTLDGDKDELETYANEILERFANPFIRHELQSIALNSISKFKVRVLPSILAFHQKCGNWPKKLCEAFAATFIFYKGEFKGTSLPLNDLASVTDFFKQAWKNPDENKVIEEVLGNTELWGEDLNSYPSLKSHLTQSLEKLKQKLDRF